MYNVGVTYLDHGLGPLKDDGTGLDHAEGVAYSHLSVIDGAEGLSFVPTTRKILIYSFSSQY